MVWMATRVRNASIICYRCHTGVCCVLAPSKSKSRFLHQCADLRWGAIHFVSHITQRRTNIKEHICRFANGRKLHHELAWHSRKRKHTANAYFCRTHRNTHSLRTLVVVVVLLIPIGVSNVGSILSAKTKESVDRQQRQQQQSKEQSRKKNVYKFLLLRCVRAHTVFSCIVYLYFLPSHFSFKDNICTFSSPTPIPEWNRMSYVLCVCFVLICRWPSFLFYFFAMHPVCSLGMVWQCRIEHARYETTTKTIYDIPTLCFGR